MGALPDWASVTGCPMRASWVSAPARGFDHESAAGVDGGAGDGGAGTDLDGHALAGEQRGIDGRGALGATVGGDLLAGADNSGRPG